MKSWAMTICLKEDPAAVAEYKRLHANSWPEILIALKTVGILQMKIFLKGQRMFMYMETVDEFVPAVDFPKHMELTPKAVEWGKVTAALQVAAPEAGEGEWWTYMEEVYDFQSQYQQFVGADGPIDLGVSKETYYTFKTSDCRSTPGIVSPGGIQLTKPKNSAQLPLSSSKVELSLTSLISGCLLCALAGYFVGAARMKPL